MNVAIKSITLHQGTIEEVNRRSDGNFSWVIDKDLTRFYSLLDHFRPQIVSRFSDEEKTELRKTLDTHKSALRYSRVQAIKNLFTQAGENKQLSEDLAQKIANLRLLELLVLIDVIEMEDATTKQG